MTVLHCFFFVSGLAALAYLLKGNFKVSFCTSVIGSLLFSSIMWLYWFCLFFIFAVLLHTRMHRLERIHVIANEEEKNWSNSFIDYEWTVSTHIWLPANENVWKIVHFHKIQLRNKYDMSLQYHVLIFVILYFQ